MPRPAALPSDLKARFVLDVLAGRTTLTKAALAAGVSAQSMWTWRKQFIEAGTRALEAAPRRFPPASRERELSAEIDSLKTALGEAHLALRSRPPSS